MDIYPAKGAWVSFLLRFREIKKSIHREAIRLKTNNIVKAIVANETVNNKKKIRSPSPITSKNFSSGFLHFTKAAYINI